MKKLPYFIILLPLVTQAETVQVPQPIFFEKNIVPKTEDPQIKTPEKSTALFGIWYSIIRLMRLRNFADFVSYFLYYIP